MKSFLACAVALILAATSIAAAQTVRGNPKSGEAVYVKHCLRCHGDKLDGKGPDAPDLIIRPTNFRAPATRSKTDWELLVALSNGVLFTPMHSFRGKLTDEQMLDVLSYIRSVAGSEAVS